MNFFFLKYFEKNEEMMKRKRSNCFLDKRVFCMKKRKKKVRVREGLGFGKNNHLSASSL